MSPRRWVRRGGAIQDGAVLRELRIERELTIAAAAELIECHAKTLSYLETERRGASDVMLAKIARVYGVKRDTLRKQPARAA